MCGITGIVQLSNQQQPLNSLIHGMTQALRHRGPDDAGYLLYTESYSTEIAGCADTSSHSWESKLAYCPKNRIESIKSPANIALGHRRLSVIDISEAGHQPMCNDTQNLWIVVNGEIYNYIEIRIELQSLGIRFNSQSDTEVLLKAYQTWGIECLDKFNGMWSFAILDLKKQIIFGARDRTGVKPLYYYRSNDLFCFASETKALLTLPFVDKSIDTQACASYFILDRIDYKGQTLFSSITELPPSSYFIIDLQSKKIQIEKYYQLPVNRSLGRINRDTQQQHTAQTRHLLYNAIELRLRSDIPVGFCLSGGIDSSSIVCIANELLQKGMANSLSNGHVVAFTAVNNSQAHDETHWASHVVDNTNIEWIKAECTSGNMIELLPKIVRCQEAPLISTSTYAQYKVMEAASQRGIQVLVDGQGSDELFAGYTPFYTSLYLDLIRQLRFLDLSREIKHISNSPNSLSIFASSILKLFVDKSLPQLLKTNVFGKMKQEVPYLNRSIVNEVTKNLPLSRETSSLSVNNLLEEYFTGYYLNNLLRWEDRSSMHFSIESRTPFADDLTLTEYVFSIPAIYKIYEGWSKSLLREAMKATLPEIIRTRTDKKGFSTPQNQWLINENIQIRDMIEQLPDNTNIIDRKKLLNDWKKIYSSQYHQQQMLGFKYLTFLLWQQSSILSK